MGTLHLFEEFFGIGNLQERGQSELAWLSAIKADRAISMDEAGNN